MLIKELLGLAQSFFGKDHGLEANHPSFDLIKPRRRGGREVNMEARMTSEPGFDRGRFVRAIVVHHQMHIQVRRHTGFDGVQKAHEFATPMAPVYLASRDVQRREQRGRAVTHVIVRASLRHAGCQRQYGLRAIERLNLALLVHAQHHGLKRRIQVKPDDISHLVDEHRITGEFERFLPMRLQTKGTPHPRDRRLRQFHLTSHRAGAPVSRADRYGLKRLCNDRIDARVINRPRRAGPRRIEQSVQTIHDEPRPRLRDRLLSAPLFRRTLLLSRPSAQANTMRARNAGACAVLRRNVSACSSLRSDSLSTSFRLGSSLPPRIKFHPEL